MSLIGEYLGTYTGTRGTPQVFFSELGRIFYDVRRSETGAEQRVPAPSNQADLVSSELLGGRHAPAIDIDLPVLAVESTTPGHFHLYIEKPMSWFRYRVMLRAMVFAGVVEPGYYRASVARRGTHLRLPWVEKERS